MTDTKKPPKPGTGAGDTSGGRQYRKLEPIIRDLDEIAREYGRDEKSVTELKNMDAFDREKVELRTKLTAVKKMVDELTDMKRGLGEGEKDVNSIKLASEIRKKLAECSKTWEGMKKVLEKEVAKGPKSKVKPEVLEDRRALLGLLGKEIVDFNERSSYTKEVKSTVEIGAVSRARAERKEKKRGRRKGRKGRGGDDDTPATGTDGDDGEPATGDDGDELDGQGGGGGGPVAPSQAQLEFMERKEKNDEEIDQALDLVSAALGDLKGMAIAINKELKVQGALLEEEEKQMDKTTEKLHTQNMKLQEILDAQGGVTRWCPILICGIILLALAGYIFKMI